MLTMMIVVLGVMVLFGTVALAFSEPDERNEQPMTAQQSVELEQPRPAMIFFQPTGWGRDGKERTVDEIVADIEAHLRQEREAARQFAKDPSASNLWL
ncbi:MAG: hypothetical protein H6707_19425 [Deltaproteobacteria bacterium]|nr:hypothetical protein [Deltaproteobacteria bacterium]